MGEWCLRLVFRHFYGELAARDPQIWPKFATSTEFYQVTPAWKEPSSPIRSAIKAKIKGFHRHKNGETRV